MYNNTVIYTKFHFYKINIFILLSLPNTVLDRAQLQRALSGIFYKIIDHSPRLFLKLNYDPANCTYRPPCAGTRSAHHTTRPTRAKTLSQPPHRATHPSMQLCRAHHTARPTRAKTLSRLPHRAALPSMQLGRVHHSVRPTRASSSVALTTPRDPPELKLCRAHHTARPTRASSSVALTTPHGVHELKLCRAPPRRNIATCHEAAIC